MAGQSRLTALLAMKLKALMADRGESGDTAGSFGGGAAAISGRTGWMLLDAPHAGLGAALAWAVRQPVDDLVVITDRAELAARMQRQAAYFTTPIAVHHCVDRQLRGVPPEPFPAMVEADPAHLVHIEAIAAAGATPIVEHGVVTGEVRGLEVCRVVDDIDSGTVRLEVGIGAHDRDAFQMLHGDRPMMAALADLVSMLTEVRWPGATAHPLNRLAAERALRAQLIERPELIGATMVVAVEPPVARRNVKDAVPCAALALIDGREVTVVCSTGVDLDLVPWAADARAAAGLSELLIAVPARDLLPVQQLVAAALREPARLVGVTAL
jgi:hypothetical protein